MRKLKRRDLPQEVKNYLEQRTDQIAKASDDKAKADTLWKNKSKKQFSAVRDTLRQMASGLERCMYCEDSEGTDIEHFWPKSKYPRQAFLWKNYLLACSACNSNYKRTQFPLDGNDVPLLIDPTKEDPRAHLLLTPTTGKYDEQTPKGTQSVGVYGLDRPVLETARMNAWITIQLHIIEYDAAMAEGNQKYAEKLKRVTCELPQSSVLIAILEVSSGPKAAKYIKQPCLKALSRRPEVRTWLD